MLSLLFHPVKFQLNHTTISQILNSIFIIYIYIIIFLYSASNVGFSNVWHMGDEKFKAICFDDGWPNSLSAVTQARMHLFY